MTRDEIEALIATLKLNETNSRDISAGDLRGLLELNPEGPYHFVNLLKYKKQATYPSGHPLSNKTMSGEEAYKQYGIVAIQHVTRRGGRLMQSSTVKLAMGGGHWDGVATMEYQNISAFFEMLADPDYQEALVHRDAGLDVTQVFVTKPLIKNPIGLK